MNLQRLLPMTFTQRRIHMSSGGDFTEEIRVGDRFEWGGYEKGLSAKTWQRIEIVDITKNSDGEIWIASCKINGSGEPVDESTFWNEESVVREMVHSQKQPWKESAYDPDPRTTSNPRCVQNS